MKRQPEPSRKRLIVDLTVAQHADVLRRAKKLNTTVSNLIRRQFGFPEKQQGDRKDLDPKRRQQNA